MSQLIIVASGIVVIIAYSIYNFGDILSIQGKPSATYGTKVTPSGSGSISLTKTASLYENRDTPQNYYSIQVPSDAQVVYGVKASNIIAKFKDNTSLSVGLADIPDTTTTQLYILTQEEPRIKSAVQDYSLLSVRPQNQTSATGAWNFAFVWKNGTQPMKTMEYFVEGFDHTALLSYTAPASQFDLNNSTITAIQQSFRWIG